MSLQDDIKLVKQALIGSSHPDWPEPEPGDERYPTFQAFFRICDQLPGETKSYFKWRDKRSKDAVKSIKAFNKIRADYEWKLEGEHENA